MFDGKDHAVTGSPNEDTRAVQKIDDRTMEFQSKKGGKVTVNGKVVVSPDGKTRTVTTRRDRRQRQKVRHGVAIYDKVG